jgi:iron complex outermembrane receptor protein
MSLRGVGSNSLDQGVDQSVSLNVDGLAVTHGLAYRAATFDLAQVEVLKGPQALYFGKNSTAGVISFRSADPGDELEVKANVGYEFESEEKRAELVISTPVSETVGLRLAGFYGDSKGIFRNRATALPGTGAKDPRYKTIGGGENFFLRGTVLWEPEPDLTVRIKANYAGDRMRQGGLNQLSFCPDGTGSLPGAPPFIHPDDSCQFDKTVYFVDLDPASFPTIRNQGTPFLDLDQYFGTVDISYDVTPEINFTSVTGFYKSIADTMINGTFQGYAAPAFFADNHFTRREWTQEFRLDSDFASPFNFTGGFFYQDGRISYFFTLGGNGALSLPPILTQGTSVIDVESVSGFGQLRYAFSDQLEITGGVRYTDEKRNLGVTQTDPFGLVTGTPGAVYDVALAPGSDKLRSKNWSPEFTITYTPTDDFTLFGAVKQAYKSGSFVIVIPGNPGQDKSFGDEKVFGGEIGMKTRMMDRDLSVDLAGYFYEYKGLQTGVNEPAQNGLPVLRTVNAGTAEVYGIDFEASYRPSSIDGLGFNLAVNWNKTKFTDLNNVPCFGGQLISQGCNQFFNPLPPDGTPRAAYTQGNPAPGAILDPGGSGLLGRYSSQDLSGIPFVRAPEWQVNFGFDYEMPVGDEMRLVFANDNQFSSSYLTILGNPDVRPYTVQPKSLKVDASLTLYGPDDSWNIALIGKNLTDKLRPGYCSSYNSQGASIFYAPIAGGNGRNESGLDEVGCSSAAGRALWVRLGVQF